MDRAAARDLPVHEHLPLGPGDSARAGDAWRRRVRDLAHGAALRAPEAIAGRRRWPHPGVLDPVPLHVHRTRLQPDDAVLHPDLPGDGVDGGVRRRVAVELRAIRAGEGAVRRTILAAQRVRSAGHARGRGRRRRRHGDLGAGVPRHLPPGHQPRAGDALDQPEHRIGINCHRHRMGRRLAAGTGRSESPAAHGVADKGVRTQFDGAGDRDGRHARPGGLRHREQQPRVRFRHALPGEIPEHDALLQVPVRWDARVRESRRVHKLPDDLRHRYPRSKLGRSVHGLRPPEGHDLQEDGRVGPRPCAEADRGREGGHGVHRQPNRCVRERPDLPARRAREAAGRRHLDGHIQAKQLRQRAPAAVLGVRHAAGGGGARAGDDRRVPRTTRSRLPADEAARRHRIRVPGVSAFKPRPDRLHEQGRSPAP